jgi:hypothetical protein
LQEAANVSEEHATSIFGVEDGSSSSKSPCLLTVLQIIKTRLETVAAVKTSRLISQCGNPQRSREPMLGLFQNATHTTFT